MSVPADLRYTREHEWARREEDGSVTIGITAHAQESLGDIVYVELPPPGTQITAGESFGVVDSVKATSELFAPCDGEVVAINEALTNAPGTVNEDPYGGGWLIRATLSDPAAFDALLDADAYAALLVEEAV